MSALSLLADHEAETINGGWRNTLMFSSFTTKTVLNSLYQSNFAKNITTGFGGISIIDNEQLNVASITSVIGG
jgi:hypothetical protein